MDEERTDNLVREHNGLYLDFSRQNMTETTLQLLLNLAERAKLRTKMNAMFSGEHINSTEDRAVLHTALRAPRGEVGTFLGLAMRFSALAAWLSQGQQAAPCCALRCARHVTRCGALQ